MYHYSFWNYFRPIGDKCSFNTQCALTLSLGFVFPFVHYGNFSVFTRHHGNLRIKVTPDLHLAYSKNGGNLGLVLKMKNIACLSILLTKHVKLFIFV